jgi:hypothetical protein
MSLTPQQIDTFIVQTSSWIQSQQNIYRPQSKYIPIEIRARIATYFDSFVIDNAQFIIVTSIENPPFFSDLLSLGIPLNTLNFSSMSGITFIDTFLLKWSKIPFDQIVSLFFHELVHVVQYALLGLDRFSREYICGYISSDYDYSKIPLERIAYDLENQFKNSNIQFSVKDELIKYFKL